MHAHHEFAEHLRELLAGVGAVRLRPMFGGLGVYLDDCMFGLVMDETLYLKTDHASVDAFRDAGGEPFRYRPVREGMCPATGRLRPKRWSRWRPCGRGHSGRWKPRGGDLCGSADPASRRPRRRHARTARQAPSPASGGGLG